MTDHISYCTTCKYRAHGQFGAAGTLYFCGHVDGKDKWGTIGFVSMVEPSPHWCPLSKKSKDLSIKGKMLRLRDKVVGLTEKR